MKRKTALWEASVTLILCLVLASCAETHTKSILSTVANTLLSRGAYVVTNDFVSAN